MRINRIQFSLKDASSFVVNKIFEDDVPRLRDLAGGSYDSN
jgi:hypothetical protein